MNEERNTAQKPRIVSHERARTLEKEPPVPIKKETEQKESFGTKKPDDQSKRPDDQSKSPRIINRLTLSIVIILIILAFFIYYYLNSSQKISELTVLSSNTKNSTIVWINEDKFTILFRNHNLEVKQQGSSTLSITIIDPIGSKTELSNTIEPFIPTRLGEHKTEVRLSDGGIFVNSWVAVREPQPKLNLVRNANETNIILENPSDFNASVYIYYNSNKQKIELPPRNSYNLTSYEKNVSVNAFVYYPQLQLFKQLDS